MRASDPTEPNTCQTFEVIRAAAHEPSPGPWDTGTALTTPLGFATTIIDADYRYIGMLLTCREHSAANIALVKAAPELLAVAKYVMWVLEDLRNGEAPDVSEALRRLREAVERAQGVR